MLLNHQLCHTFYTDRLYMASANEALSAIVDSGKKEREAAYSIWMMIATVP
jgi:hypothetical protein